MGLQRTILYEQIVRYPNYEARPYNRWKNDISQQVKLGIEYDLNASRSCILVETARLYLNGSDVSAELTDMQSDGDFISLTFAEGQSFILTGENLPLEAIAQNLSRN